MIIREKPEEDLKKLIGPHEERELELMLKGEKPLARFYEILNHDEEFGLIPEKEFQPYVDSGQIVKRELIRIDSSSEQWEIRYVYYALTSETKRIDQLIQTENDWENGMMNVNDIQQKTGELLGYSKEAIDYFIKRWNIRRTSEQITKRS